MTGRRLGPPIVPLTIMALNEPADIGRVIAETARQPGGCLLLPPDGLTTRIRAEIAALALGAGLPVPPTTHPS